MFSCLHPTGPIEVLETRYTHHHTAFVSWRFDLSDHRYRVELKHGTVWGKRNIYINGEKVVRERKLIDGGSSHELYLPGVKKGVVTVKILALDLCFNYELLVDGVKLSEIDSSRY